MARCSHCGGSGELRHENSGGVWWETCHFCGGSGKEEKAEHGRCSVCGAPLEWRGGRGMTGVGGGYVCSSYSCSSHW